MTSKRQIASTDPHGRWIHNVNRSYTQCIIIFLPVYLLFLFAAVVTLGPVQVSCVAAGFKGDNRWTSKADALLSLCRFLYFKSPRTLLYTKSHLISILMKLFKSIMLKKKKTPIFLTIKPAISDLKINK